jgi:hypothetical protein
MDMLISIPEEIALRLKERAAKIGQTMPAYTTNLVVEAVTKPTLDELLAPVRDDFAKTGMTGDEIMDLGREILTAVRQENKAKPA